MYNQVIGEEVMYRILIIEDDRGIAGAVASQAKLWNLEARQVSDFSNVMSEFAQYSPALCLGFQNEEKRCRTCDNMHTLHDDSRNDKFHFLSHCRRAGYAEASIPV